MQIKIGLFVNVNKIRWLKSRMKNKLNDDDESVLSTTRTHIH